MSKNTKLFSCENNHFFINKNKCPYCGSKIKKEVEIKPGDCIKCGGLCGAELYCCTSPCPMN